MASPIDRTPRLSGDDAARLLDDLERGCGGVAQARRVEAARAHLAETFHQNADALHQDPRDPPGVLRVVRTGALAQRPSTKTGTR
jgi:hypothetical protein